MYSIEKEMKTEEITIANLSCSGCVNTITKKLSEKNDVDSVLVELESSKVSVRGTDTLIREDITNTLRSLGYPEATEENGLLTKARSINSCLTGRLSN